jgi:hypothetical protein
MPTARPYRHKDASGPTCRRLQATHINLLSNLINPAEVRQHLFIMLAAKSCWVSREENNSPAGACRSPPRCGGPTTSLPLLSFSLRSSGNQTDRRTRRRSRGGCRRQGAVVVAVRRRRASYAHRRASNLARLGTATEAGRSPASASA